MNKKYFQILIGATVITGALVGMDRTTASAVTCPSAPAAPKGCMACGRVPNMNICIAVCQCQSLKGDPTYPELLQYNLCNGAIIYDKSANELSCGRAEEK